MYEQISHALLNDILIELKPEIKRQPLQHFYIRLGANFYTIHTLFFALYGDRPDFREQMQRLVETLTRQYIRRPPALRRSDLAREEDHNWFLSQQWVGMALYCDSFADDLKGLKPRLHYLQDLGVNLVHIMPMLDCPPDHSDGGYAVRDFRRIDPRFGTLKDLDAIAAELRKRGMLLALDVVVNHTSDEHEWARKARAGDPTYQDYYFVFDDRQVPDMYEEAMPEVFPHAAPGNFTWDAEMGKWVMTVFHNYQWDLNYRNPAVFIEMLDILLYWANRGADILRLDAVAFLWKKIGSTCQNEHEAHQILRLLKSCCQITAPGVLFIAEAIVAPLEIIKYFGQDAIMAKECEIAYNATFMALLWEAVATKKADLLTIGIRNLPEKLDRATWLNYVRCHDDIGWGFSDSDIIAAGYDPKRHRKFLVDYYTERYAGSHARGLAFGRNELTGDARISGSLASLAGLEYALEHNDLDAIEAAVKTIILLHSMILSFGGIPLLYYGDALGTLNDNSYLDNQARRNDNRWVNRPRMDWEKAARRNQPRSIEYRIFSKLKKLISVRKEIPAFADCNNREVLDVPNPHLIAFLRTAPSNVHGHVIVAANFDTHPQPLGLEPLRQKGYFHLDSVINLCTGETLDIPNGELEIPPLTCYWLKT